MRAFLQIKSLWVLIGIVGLAGCEGPAGNNGTPCSATDNKDGTFTVTCGDGTAFTVKSGKDGTKGTSCKVTENSDGTKTIACDDGTTATIKDGTGVNGANGTNGTNGANGQGTSPAVTDNHGLANFYRTGEYAACAPGVTNCDKKLVKVAITKATADEAGKVTVEFTVKDAADKPVVGLKAPGVYLSIVKLEPPAGGLSFAQWVPYIVSSVAVTKDGTWPGKVGDKRDNPNREAAGKLTDKADGSYIAELTTNISKITANGAAVKYDRSLTHRVAVWMGGHAGATGAATFDFVPAGGAVSTTRDVVSTVACKQCHGPDFKGHGGDRLAVEDCVMCHNYNYVGVYGKQSADFASMLHKIHAGYEIASVAGPDGIVFDDPGTAKDESADNGHYIYYRERNGVVGQYEWSKVGFPAVIENCTKCHQGTGKNVDNWKNVPSRQACGSCHDNVDFAAGKITEHYPKSGTKCAADGDCTTDYGAGATCNTVTGVCVTPHIAVTDDKNCGTCHPATGKESATVKPIAESHAWMTKDPRNIPEFDVQLSISGASGEGGKYFKAGDKPVVKLVLKENGVALTNHDQITDDDVHEGCLETGCPDRDNKFHRISLYVAGPRANRMPVLLRANRAAIVGTVAATYNITGGKLDLLVDNGKDVFTGGATPATSFARGSISVDVADGIKAASCGANPCIASAAAATAQEIVNWLNTSLAFKARAIAYLDEATGAPAIRSRKLAAPYAVQLKTGVVTTAVFGGVVTAKLPGSAASLLKYIDATKRDPMVTWAADGISYQLDPVDDLPPGTYIASVELSDRGQVTTTNYKAPSVAKLAFQVKTGTEQLPPAADCQACHQGPDGKGFVLDFYRHYKIFDQSAVDQCGACHDYQPSSLTGPWTSGKPISKRVHAVHVGSTLNYPLLTVDYDNGDPVKGRYWNITLPMAPQLCDASCHQPKTTSGSWATKPGRLPCSGCHDSDTAQAHIKANTFDPTPADPWSGDEAESCKACH